MSMIMESLLSRWLLPSTPARRRPVARARAFDVAGDRLALHPAFVLRHAGGEADPLASQASLRDRRDGAVGGERAGNELELLLELQRPLRQPPGARHLRRHDVE